jgi:phage shock protein A
MTANQVRGLVTATVIVIGAGALGRVSGQAIQPRGGDDILPALLVEVKGLRAAMEQMATAGPKVQLFASRLQLQEGRIAGMARRLDTVRDNLASAQREYNQLRGSLQMLGADKSTGDASEDTEGVLGGLKAQVAAAKTNVDRLRAEEMQITQDVAAEQARWVEINQRLDDLERALTPKG